MMGIQAIKHEEFRTGRDHCKRFLTKRLQDRGNGTEAMY